MDGFRFIFLQSDSENDLYIRATLSKGTFMLALNDVIVIA